MNIDILEKAKLKLINELLKDKYGFSQNSHTIFKKRCHSFDINIFNKNNTSSIVLLNDLSEKYQIEYTVPNYNNSSVLEYPPILIENSFIFFKPVICLSSGLNDEDSIYSFYHELFHILGTSEWKYNKISKCMNRKSGILDDSFSYIEKKIEKIEKNSNEKTYLNEFFNDYVTSYFFEKIYGKQGLNYRIAYNKHMRKNLNHYVVSNFDNNITNFIEAYLNNKLIFDELEKYFPPDMDREL